MSKKIIRYLTPWKKGYIKKDTNNTYTLSLAVNKKNGVSPSPTIGNRHYHGKWRSMHA